MKKYLCFFVADLKGDMRVYVPVRPRKKGKAAAVKKRGFKTVEFYLKTSKTPKAFEFSKVYDPKATQENFF